MAKQLAEQGADVVSVFGSSLTFYKGRNFHEDLIAQVAKATGKTATTQSASLSDGLKTINAKRVAMAATAYTDRSDRAPQGVPRGARLRGDVHAGPGLRLDSGGRRDNEILFQLGVACYGRSQKADALVMSCGRLNTLDLLAPLEGNMRVPVVSSTPHGLMNGVRLLETVTPGKGLRDGLRRRDADPATQARAPRGRRRGARNRPGRAGRRRVVRERPAAELRPLVIGERQLQLRARVHDERPVLRHRFGDRPPLQQQDLHRPVNRLNLDVQLAGTVMAAGRGSMVSPTRSAPTWNRVEALSSRAVCMPRAAGTVQVAPSASAIDQIATSASSRAAHELGGGASGVTPLNAPAITVTPIGRPSRSVVRSRGISASRSIVK